VHLGHPRIHIHRPRITRLLAPAEVPAERALAYHVVAFCEVEVLEIVQGYLSLAHGLFAFRLGVTTLASDCTLFLFQVGVWVASQWRCAERVDWVVEVRALIGLYVMCFPSACLTL
jgi:hypothetical protein